MNLKIDDLTPEIKEKIETYIADMLRELTEVQPMPDILMEETRR